MPAGFEPFDPPISQGLAAHNCAPAIAEWTHSALADEALAVTGQRLTMHSGQELGRDTRFVIFSQTRASGPRLGDAQIQALRGESAILTLPASLPTGAYLLWPENSAGRGRPVLVNRTELWWLGPDQAGRGEKISAFGRNLQLGTALPAVYVQSHSGSFGAYARVLSHQPYKVDFELPLQLPYGPCKVWVHNGHGARLGWSSPVDLEAGPAPAWNGPELDAKNPSFAGGAKGDGITDDRPALQAALDAAGLQGGSTLRLPAGNYAVSGTLRLSPGTRLKGQGAALSRLSCRPGFGGDQFLLGATDCALEDLGVQAAGTRRPGMKMLFMRGCRRLALRRLEVHSPGMQALDLSDSSLVLVQDCRFTGGNHQNSALFMAQARQVLIERCGFYGTYDANVLVEAWSSQELAMQHSSAQDFDSGSNTGWAQGRFFYGNQIYGSQRLVYLGENQSRDLAVRPGFQNSNSGEQMLWEGNFTKHAAHPLSAGRDSLILPGLPKELGSRHLAVVLRGRGLGQHRLITSYDQATGLLKVSPPWQLPPDRDSLVAVASGVEKCVLYRNSLQGKADYASRFSASSGIQPYGNSFDFIADSNAIERVRTGISSWSRAETNQVLARPSIEPCYFNLYKSNRISAVLSGALSIMSGWEASWSGDPGVMYLGNIFRGNHMEGAVTAFELSKGGQSLPPGRPMDMNAFEGNTGLGLSLGFDCRATDDARPLGAGLGCTLFYKNDLAAGPAPGSTGIRFGLGQEPVLRLNRWTRFQAPYGGDRPGPVISAPFLMSEIPVPGGVGSLVVWNAGTAGLSLSMDSSQQWLNLGASSAVLDDENSSFTFTYSAQPPGSAGPCGDVRLRAGSLARTLQVCLESRQEAVADSCVPELFPPKGDAGQAPSPGPGESYIYPSPAKGSFSTLAYRMAHPGRARISVYNELGRLVDQVEQEQPAGPCASRISTGSFAPGVYLYSISLHYASGESAQLPPRKFSVVR